MIRRNLAIDAARGVFAWTVVAVHVAWISGGTESNSRAAIGNWAVTGFAVLAGYMAIATWKKEPYGRYLVKRAFRILPVFLAAWALCLLVGTTLVPAWFIGLLIQFYLVLPGLMRVIKRFGDSAVLWFLGAGLFGMLPLVYDHLKRYFPMGEFLPMNFFWFALGMALFLVADQRKIEKWTAPGWLARSGELSYSTFLVHWPVLTAVSYLSWGPLALTLLGLPLVLIFSILFYRWVELPGIRAGRMIFAKKTNDCNSAVLSEVLK
jgi:peptidoglycan/LPS O-acetylase OafA/YrhL